MSNKSPEIRRLFIFVCVISLVFVFYFLLMVIAS